jgi:pantoate kinase
MPVSEAACPAGISSFFEICDVDSNGNRLKDAARIGARGGGFAIRRGVRARVAIRGSPKSRISIRINSKPAPEAKTTRWAIEHLLAQHKTSLNVSVDLKISIPIAAGFGTSAAGTAASCLALADSANLQVTFNDLGRITHIADVVNRTGLGTAAAVFVGGFVLVTEPGAPGVGSVDRLMFPTDHSIVCAYLGPLPTREALSQIDLASRVNPRARETMAQIRKKPDLSTFLNASRRFGQQTGFQSPDVQLLVRTMISAGAVGAAQNMIGKAVHAVVEDRKADRLVRLVKRKFPSAIVFATRLDERGVRLIRNQKPKH